VAQSKKWTFPDCSVRKLTEIVKIKHLGTDFAVKSGLIATYEQKF